MSGRIRTVKPEWGEDERLVMASEAARVLSVLLLLWSDDHGNGRAGPEPLLAFKAFPRNPKLYRTAMIELVSMGYVSLYDAEGQSYFHIRNWKKHQLVKNPSKPRVPEPSTDTLRRPSVDSTETVTLDPDPIPRSHTPIPIPTPRTKKAKRPPDDDPAAEVIREHRRLLTTRGVETSDKVTESSLVNARKVLKEWPQHWAEVLAVFVAYEDPKGWLSGHRWPLSSLLRFADDYDTRWKNAGREAPTTKTGNNMLAFYEEQDRELAEELRREEEKLRAAQ